MKTIETFKVATDFVEKLEKMTADELEKKYKHGDSLFMGDEMAFRMINYSLDGKSNNSQISRYVTYFSTLFDCEINLDREKNTVIFAAPYLNR